MLNAVRRVCALGFVCLLSIAGAVRAQVSVTTYHNDNARTGQNTQETILTTANVNSAQFGKLFSVAVDGVMYAEPLYLYGVNIAGGVHNVVYAATEHDSVYGIDADTGTVYFQVSLIPAGGATVNSWNDLQCGDLMPEIGITGTPVIDPSTNTLYVVAKSKVNGNFVQYLHALDVTSGAEKLGGPKLIQGSVASNTADGNGTTVAFDPKLHNQRAALLLENGHVVIAWGSHCDINPWHGWVMSYNAATLAQEAIYDTTTTQTSTDKNGCGGIWMGGGGLASDSAGNIYFATGNGAFNGTTDLSDSVVKIGPPAGGTFPVVDYFTPFDQANLQSGDTDVGSGGLVLLPPSTSGVQLLAQQGKEGTIYLLNTANMGHYCVPNCTNKDTQIVQEIQNATSGIWGAPAYWNGYLYWVGANDAIYAYSFNPSLAAPISTTPASQSAQIFAYAAPTPAISSNGTTNGILWAVDGSANDSGCDGSTKNCLGLFAYDATNLGKLLYNSRQAANNRDALAAGVKFVTPVIANGKVYVGTQGALSVFGLLSQNPTAATPGLSPAPGSYSTTTPVSLSDGTPGATIYYTTNGTTPSAASTPYNNAPIQVSATTTISAIAVAPGYVNSPISSGTYVIGTQSSPLPVTLAAADNVNAIAANGTAVNAGGIDGLGYAYSGTLLGTSVTWGGSTFTFGAAGTTNAVSSATIALPAGSDTAVTLLATAVNGNQNNQVFVVTYTDGTTTNYTQSLSDWFAPQNFAGESKAVSMAYRLAPDGSTDNRTFYLYGYSFAINSAKTVKSITLPNNRNVVVLAVDLTPAAPVGPVAATPVPNPLPGNFNAAQNVTLSDSTPGATIYYTTNGSTPSAASTPYANAAIPITGTTTLNAIAVANGYGNSAVGGGTYTITLPAAATPVPNPQPGNFTTGQNVTLSDATPGAVIYYTLDGSTPTTASTPYTNKAIAINATTTLKAIAMAAGYANSASGGGTYTITLPVTAAPVPTPLPGSFTTSQNVTFADATPGAAIYYTLDGSTPTANSTPYAANTQIAINSTTTLNAIAVAPGYANSALGGGTYVIGTQSSPLPVTLTSAANVTGIVANGTAVPNGGVDGLGYAYSATLLGSYLTYGGSTFTFGALGSANAVSSTTLPLPAGYDTAVTLLAVGVNGNQKNQVFVVTYTDGTTTNVTQSLSDWFSPQNYAGESKALTMAYRLAPNGSTDNRTFYLYGYSFAINSAKTVQSITLPNNRNVVVFGVDVTPAAPVGPVAATPVPNPLPGNFTAGQNVTLSDATAGAAIYYTLDGSPPSTASTPYLNTPIPVNATTTINAIAVASGYANSAIGGGTYTINLPVTATPVPNPLPGSFTTGQNVALSDSTPGATIYYTTNGSPATAASTPYANTPIAINATTTLNAIAVTPGYANSAPLSATYAIGTQSSPLPVTLTTNNVTGIVANGTAVPNGGVDGNGYAYSATLLGTSVTWNGSTYTLGALGAANAVSSTTIALPASYDSAVTLLAVGVNGNQNNQVFVVTYTDGTTTNFTQSLSDWYSPQNYAGESKALTMAYRLNQNGTTDNRTFYLYGYSFAINSAKTVKSITLPNNRNVVVFGVDVTPAAPVGPVAATPVPNPMPGNFTAGQNVTLSDTTAGAAIYYTLDGSQPTAASTPYANVAIAINSTATLNAIAVANGYGNSAIGGGLYTITLPAAAAPVPNPQPGTFTTAQYVTLSDGTPGAAIYYTMDGSTPTANSTPYVANTQIAVNATTTLNAIAVAPGYANSALGGGTYIIGTQSSPVGVTLTDNITGIVANGTAVQNGGIDGLGNAYSATLLGTTLTWGGSTYTFGALGAPNALSSATVALPAGSASAVTLLATGINGNQKNQTFVVTYTDGTTTSFTQSLSDWFSPQNYAGETKVLAMAYRLNPNGSTDNRTFYLYGYSIAVNSAKTIQSITLPNNRNVVVLGIDVTPAPIAAAPLPNPLPNSFTGPQSVTLSDTTTGAVIYYTLDGSMPTTASTPYANTAIAINMTTTLNAIAVAPGYVASPAAGGTYTITAGP